MFEARDPPYPELKKSHTMARRGRPWTDFKPPPAAPVWAAIEGLGRYHVLVAALELDMFDALRDLGPSTSADVAEELGTSEPHTRMLLDAVVALDLLDQTNGVYELNDTARRYLVSDGPACMAALVPVAPGPHANWTRLADTVRNGRPAEPIEDDPEDFYVALAEGTFTTMLRCAARADLKLRYSVSPAPRVLDLGAGGAPWTIAILTACPAGTAAVNDLPAVLDVARRKITEHGVADRCDLRPGDYHTIPIEDESFDIAVLGHVCRAEGVAGAGHLVERAFRALRPGGRLILGDYFCDPEHKSNPHAVMMAATMMASTLLGSTFTVDEVAGWLRSAGFESLRLIEPIGFQQCLVATRPRQNGGTS
jgi:ubiquinone/menaquinone biosynthesis C-methylase UbiE